MSPKPIVAVVGEPSMSLRTDLKCRTMKIGRICRYFSRIEDVALSVEDVVALVIRVEGISFDAILEGRMRFPFVRIIVVSDHASDQWSGCATSLGAHAVILSPRDASNICDACFGETYRHHYAAGLPSLSRIESEYIHTVMKLNNWNVSRSAQTLGIARQSLQRKLRKAVALQ